MVLICFSLPVSEDKHLFIYLKSIQISFPLQYLFMSFDHFFYRVIIVTHIITMLIYTSVYFYRYRQNKKFTAWCVGEKSKWFENPFSVLEKALSPLKLGRCFCLFAYNLLQLPWNQFFWKPNRSSDLETKEEQPDTRKKKSNLVFLVLKNVIRHP